MKPLIYISLLLFSLSCCKKPDTKEGFLNQVRRDVLRVPSQKYFLLSNAHKIFLSNRDFEFLRNDFKKFIDSGTLNELITNATNDTLMQEWNIQLLKNAKFINLTKKLKNQIPHDMVPYYNFSRPIFDKSGKYALMSMSYYCGELCGYGCTYLFKYREGRWGKIAETNCFVN